MSASDTQVLERRTAELLTKAKQHASYIEHKFTAARQYDIDAEYLKQVLQEVTELGNLGTNLARENINSLKNLCASAISLYYEPENRPFFFEQLSRISSLLGELG